MKRLIDPSEYVNSRRPPLGLRWLWRYAGRWLA